MWYLRYMAPSVTPTRVVLVHAELDLEEGIMKFTEVRSSLDHLIERILADMLKQAGYEAKVVSGMIVDWLFEPDNWEDIESTCSVRVQFLDRATRTILSKRMGNLTDYELAQILPLPKDPI